MLAGADLLIKSMFSIKFSIISLILSIFLFFIINGGIKRIKIIFSKILPILLLLIFINLSVNSLNFFKTNGLNNWFNFKALNSKEIGMSLMLPIVFLGGNFILAVNSILNCKSKLTGYSSAFVFFVFLLLGSFVVFHIKQSSMPFLESSKNLSYVFYILYFIAIFISLFSSVAISTFNVKTLINKKDKFSLVVVILINQCLAFLGFDFIVNYLYTFTGILGGVYILVIVVKMIYLIKCQKSNQKIIKNN